MDRTELLRATLGVLAFLVAGAQITMRVMVTNGFGTDHVRGRLKERSLSITMMLLLVGVGLSNLTHLHAEPSASTILISIGIFSAAYGLKDIWHWAREEEENGHAKAHRYSRPKRHHKEDA